MSEPDVIRLNEQVMGEGDNLAAPLLLRSAVHRQWASYGGVEPYPSIHMKAAALFHGLVANHAFVDGNKRTALLAAAALCHFNGARLKATDDELVQLAVKSAAQSLSVEEVMAWFEAMVVTK